MAAILKESARQAAMAAGRFAGHRDRPVTDCPYKVDGTPVEQALAGAWMREYLRARPTDAKTVDYT